MSDPIVFVASVAKVQTMVDGGIRVVFDLPKTASMQMAQLAECQRFGFALSITATPIELEINHDGRKPAKQRKHLRTKATDE